MLAAIEFRADRRGRSIGSCREYLSDERMPSISDEQPFSHIDGRSYAPAMSETNTFGARLEARMKELGWSMPRLGKGLKAKKGGILDGDIGRAAVFGWINGAGFPNVIQLAEICKRLNISADYLLFGTRVASPRLEAAKSALRLLSQQELDELHLMQNITTAASAGDAAPHEDSTKKDVQRVITRTVNSSHLDTDGDSEEQYITSIPGKIPSRQGKKSAASSADRDLPPVKRGKRLQGGS